MGQVPVDCIIQSSSASLTGAKLKSTFSFSSSFFFSTTSDMWKYSCGFWEHLMRPELSENSMTMPW